MDYTIREAGDADRGPVVDIFNHFVRHTFAAYPDREVPTGFFDTLRTLSSGFPFLVIVAEQAVIGFGLVSPYRRDETFKHTGVLTYFIMPEYTHLGLGSALLDRLIQEAQARGISNLLANISSRNEQSLNFHRKHGFRECGRLEGIGVKFDECFDIVWMQKRV